MAQSATERLRHLSDEIEAEEMSFIIDRMAKSMMEQDDDEDADVLSRTKYEKTAIVLLRALRIQLCLDLIREGHGSCAETVRKDWKEILECLQFLEHTWEVSAELLSDAVDIILLLGPEKRKDLLRCLDLLTRFKIKQITPLRLSVANCALRMADYCLDTDRMDTMYRIAENLISLSEERNRAELWKHCIVTEEALRYVVDHDVGIACRICEAQKQYFEDTADRYACLFFWYYGCAMLNTGRTEDAFPILVKCHDLCMEVEGGTSWIGARSGILCQYYLMEMGDTEAEAYLWDSLEKIESGFYTNMDENADFVAASTRAVLLKKSMERQELRDLLPEIEQNLAYCVAMEETNISPFLTVRMAENLLSAYYLEMGDYLQAATHSHNALNAIPGNGLPADPSDVLIYTNLLLIYTALNDADQVEYYVQKLTERWDEFEDNDYVSSRAALLINNANKKFLNNPGNLDEDLEYLREVHRWICDDEMEPEDTAVENVTFAQWILDLCSGILDAGIAQERDLLVLRDIVEFFRSETEIYPFSDGQKITCFVLLTQIEWQLGTPKALDYLEEGLHYIENISGAREATIAILRFAAVVYYSYHRMEDALSAVDRMLSGVTSAWQKATAYLNDHRVCELLSFIQVHFNVCYAIVRTTASPEELYERVLRFKNLPALVGRERNKLLRLAPVNEDLKNRIFALQDQLAAAELNDSLKGTGTAKKIAAELERREAEFAEQFPRNLYFTDITFRGVCGKLPENSAILEYYFVLEKSALDAGRYDEDSWSVDVFVTSRRNGPARLDYLKLREGSRILTQAAEFLDALQNPDDLSAAGKKATLRADLYRRLIAPALPFLEGITDLYIAPDDQLCNLPFEILHADGSNLLQDDFRVCRLACGRDILFYDDQGPTDGSSFVLGDPNYESERGEQRSSRIRGGQMSLEPVADLPFSGIEAERVGRRCRCRVYSGDAATKYALQNALPCSIIHLATHGVFDDRLETDSLYASHLVFAGYNKWVSRKTESSHCGNGILTADEISRMDLHRTELVVLSACQSGLGDTSYGSVRGLLSAFSAAGARWVITHMWEASDFSTPILMDAFYNALLNKGMAVPEALRHAKNYLRTVTIGELRQNGWLDLPADRRFPEDFREALADMRNWPDSEVPFADEFFWGGFTVHKSR